MHESELFALYHSRPTGGTVFAFINYLSLKGLRMQVERRRSCWIEEGGRQREGASNLPLDLESMSPHCCPL